MCGISGIFNHTDAANLVYQMQYALQHRGQESSGIVSQHNGHLDRIRGMGHVTKAFDEASLMRLSGNAAIGHNRYSTAGGVTLEEAQPFLVETWQGAISICHNGNLPYATAVRQGMEKDGAIFSSSSDTEVVLHAMARSKTKTFPVAIAEAFTEIEGAYSMLFLTKNSLIAVRDPHGFRPLCLGMLNDSPVIASETCAFDLIGAKYIRDIGVGEMLVITTKGGEINYQSYYLWKAEEPRQCIFEHVYFSRPDSLVFGQSVSGNRHRMGRILAKEHPVAADIVVAVPDSGNAAAIGYAQESLIPLAPGITRNHYGTRTFIEPDQKIRGLKVRRKLNPDRAIIQGRRVILVDDSIIRGTTAREIVKMVREAGALEIHLRIACPPTIAPCFYGVDTPSSDQLLAANNSMEEVRAFIGADSLGYLSLQGLLSATGDAGGRLHCTACYSNQYPIPVSSLAQTKTEREGGISALEDWPRE